MIKGEPEHHEEGVYYVRLGTDVGKQQFVQVGSRTDLRLAEPIPATAGTIRKAGGHSRGILVLGVCSDLLALPAGRFGGGVKLALPAIH